MKPWAVALIAVATFGVGWYLGRSSGWDEAWETCESIWIDEVPTREQAALRNAARGMREAVAEFERRQKEN